MRFKCGAALLIAAFAGLIGGVDASITSTVKQFTGGKDIRLVYVGRVGTETNIYSRNFFTKIYIYDSKDSSTRQICPGGDTAGNYYSKPSFTSTDANRIIINNTREYKVYVVDINGQNKRVIATGFGTCCRLINGIDWAYIQISANGPIRRYNIDDPTQNELVWDKTPTGGGGSNNECYSSFFSVSLDGTRGVDCVPWPAIATFKLPNISYTKRAPNASSDWGGCWVSMTPDNSYRWHFFGCAEHKCVEQHDSTNNNSTINSSVMLTGFGTGFNTTNRFSFNDPRYIVVSGADSSSNGTTTYRPHCFLGKLSGDYKPNTLITTTFIKISDGPLQDEFPEVVVGYTTSLTAATPLIGPTTTTFSDSAVVSITSTTTGSKIYYAINGTEPTTTSALYSQPFTIRQNTTIKAQAYKTGLLQSSIAGAAFTKATLTAPVISPSGGAFPDSVRFALSAASASDTIWYTLDGSDPSGSSAIRYTAPITLKKSAFVSAQRRSAGQVSTVTNGNFSVYSSQAIITVTAPNGHEVFKVGQTITIRWLGLTSYIGGVVIDLTLNGRNWSKIVGSNQIAPTDANWGAFVWTIPDSIIIQGARDTTVSTISSNCRIDIWEYNNKATIFDLSDTTFSIVSKNTNVSVANYGALTKGGFDIQRCATGTLNVSIPYAGDHSVEINLPDGKRFGYVGGNGAANYSLLKNARTGVYIIRLTAGSRSCAQAVTLIR